MSLAVTGTVGNVLPLLYCTLFSVAFLVLQVGLSNHCHPLEQISSLSLAKYTLEICDSICVTQLSCKTLSNCINCFIEFEQKIDVATKNLNGLTEAIDIEYQFTSIWLHQLMESLQEGGRSIHSYLYHLEENLLSLPDEVTRILYFNLICSEELDMTLGRYFDFGNFMKVRLCAYFDSVRFDISTG